MALNLIVAFSIDRVIGYKNDLPWKIPEDIKHFQDITTGHTVVMGRKTYESIGRPLSSRKNVVLTKQKDFKPKGELFPLPFHLVFRIKNGQK